MRNNGVKQKLHDNDVVVGFGLSLGSICSAEIFLEYEPDFLMVDMQHGYFDKTVATNTLRLISRSPSVPFVRVASNDSAHINDALDAGALGIVVPMVNTKDEAERAVRATYYAPKGERSRSSLVCTIYGDDYHARANDLISLVIMLETQRACDNIEEILAVPGIDCCLIGPSDLTLSMNSSVDSEAFRKTAEHVANAARKNHIACGLAVPTAKDAEKWHGRGVSMFLATHDTALMRNYTSTFVASFGRLKDTSPV